MLVACATVAQLQAASAGPYMQSNIADCDEFANNTLHLNCTGVPVASKLDNVHNILYMDTSKGREAHARMY